MAGVEECQALQHARLVHLRRRRRGVRVLAGSGTAPVSIGNAYGDDAVSSLERQLALLDSLCRRCGGRLTEKDHVCIVRAVLMFPEDWRTHDIDAGPPGRVLVGYVYKSSPLSQRICVRVASHNERVSLGASGVTFEAQLSAWPAASCTIRGSRTCCSSDRRCGQRWAARCR